MNKSEPDRRAGQQRVRKQQVRVAIHVRIIIHRQMARSSLADKRRLLAFREVNDEAI